MPRYEWGGLSLQLHRNSCGKGKAFPHIRRQSRSRSKAKRKADDRVMILRRSVRVLITACALVLISTPLFFSSAHNISPSVIQPQQNDPGTSLSRGRTLLRQGHADQALGYLETALNLYTQSNNRRGVAAAEDGLGDLYMLQGQYKVALDHYQKAYEAFVA